MGTDASNEHVREAFAEGVQLKEGSYRFRSCTTPDNQPSVSTGCIPPNRVVPIIFVPGIMGSNLKAKIDIVDGDGNLAVRAETPVWRVDGKPRLAWAWGRNKQDQYQLRFQYDKVAVDDRGEIPTRGASRTTEWARLTEAQARARGWGTVSAVFYGEFLDWLDSQLNDPQRIFSNGSLQDNPALTTLKQTATRNPMGTLPGYPDAPLKPEDLEVLLKADNPVHAFGYNWLQSNLDSGKELAQFIKDTKAHYNNGASSCEQVILVTHSMGGLVARAACTVHGAASDVAGVFHGVMPTDGAAATYKRMVSGFGGEPTHGLFGWLTDWVGAKALGPTGDYVTPSLALNAGPLELLPNARYNDQKPWLFVKDAAGKVVKALPSSKDPYNEIYLEQEAWWRMLNMEWLNPAGLNERELFNAYRKAVDRAADFHSSVQEAGDFHPNTHAHYGNDPDYHAYGTVSWQLRGPVDDTRHTTLQRERLPNVEAQVGMNIYLVDAHGGVRASLSDPDAAGDGTVPAQASAMAVDKAVKPNHVLARGVGYSHDASYEVQGRSEGYMAALQSIVRVLQSAVTTA